MDHKFTYPAQCPAGEQHVHHDSPEADKNEGEFLKKCQHDLETLNREKNVPKMPQYPRE